MLVSSNSLSHTGGERRKVGLKGERRREKGKTGMEISSQVDETGYAYTGVESGPSETIMENGAKSISHAYRIINAFLGTRDHTKTKM